jgi:radical SAM protein with 4Fe4S-binding SPASM domain
MECTDKLTGDLDFIREFNKKSEQLRVPISGSIELTHRCNLGCVHCYLGKTSNKQKLHDNEMSTSQVLSVIDELTEAGCLYLLITGGEPLLRKDFSRIYSHAKQKGLILTIFTNGTLVTDRIADLFADMPPRVVEISLYGATSTTYEKVTRVSGSYNKCLNAVRRLLERKIPVGLKTILMTLNKHEFTEIEDIAKNFGVKFRFDAAIFPRLNGDKSPLNLRVSPEEAVEMEFTNMDRARTWEQYFTRSKGQSPNDKMYNCGAGLTSFHIDPYGNLQPCIMPTGLKFDLAKGGFLKGWRGIISVIRSRKAGNISFCNHCEKRHLCGFCPAFFKLENGKEEICSEYLCSMGSLRFLEIEKLYAQGEYNAA